jgi:hypothetical protein
MLAWHKVGEVSRMITVSLRRLTLALCGCLLLTGPVWVQAQNYDNPGLGEKPVSAHPQDFKPLGIRAGGFMLHPGVQLAAEFTDNVFYTAEDTEDDLVWHIRPYISAQSNWSRHAFNVLLAADIARHQDYSFRDYEDYFLLIDGRVDVRSRSYFSYTLDYMKLHEGLGTRSSQQGLEPTTYDLYGGSIGYDHSFNRLSVGVAYDMRKLDYDDSISLDEGVIDNQDRDRRESAASVRLGYQFQTDKQAFVKLFSHKTKFDQPVDRNGKDRNNDGWSAHAGLAFNVTGKLNGDVYAAYHERSYDDPSLNGISGWAGGARLGWTPTQMTSVGVSISSGIEETTYEYASGYLFTLYSLRVDHELLRDLQISGTISYRENDYELTNDAPAGARSKDDLWQAGLGLTYFINRYLFFSASYTHESLGSNVPTDEFDVNRLWLTLSLER